MISVFELSPTHTLEAAQTPRWWTLNKNLERSKDVECLKSEQTVRDEQKLVPISSGGQKAF